MSWQDVVNGVTQDQITAATRATATAQSTASNAGAVAATKLSANPTAYSPARTLDTPFMISAAHPALVIYSVSISVTAGLLATSTGQVSLLIDTINPPVAVAGVVSNQAEGLSGLSLQFLVQNGYQLTGWVPAGSWVELQSRTSGIAATITLTNVTELVFS